MRYLESQAELEQFLVAGCPVAVDLGVIRISLDGLIIVLHSIRELSCIHTHTHVQYAHIGTHTGEEE